MERPVPRGCQGARLSCSNNLSVRPCAGTNRPTGTAWLTCRVFVPSEFGLERIEREKEQAVRSVRLLVSRSSLPCVPDPIDGSFGPACPCWSRKVEGTNGCFEKCQQQCLLRPTWTSTISRLSRLRILPTKHTRRATKTCLPRQATAHERPALYAHRLRYRCRCCCCCCSFWLNLDWQSPVHRQVRPRGRQRPRQHRQRMQKKGISPRSAAEGEYDCPMRRAQG